MESVVVSLSRFVRVTDIMLRAMTGMYQSLGSRAETDCVLVPSFGFQRTANGILPGRTNEYLASQAALLAVGRPILAQAEVYDALVDMGAAQQVYKIAARDKGYFDTRAFLLECMPVLTAHCYRLPLIIAHPHHLPRTQATAHALGLDISCPGGLQAVWDKTSEQAWTRSVYTWMPREVVTIYTYARRKWL
jgi:hypothetical protein